jgi:hypothetical protein
MKYSISSHSQQGAMPCAPTIWFNYLKNAVCTSRLPGIAIYLVPYIEAQKHIMAGDFKFIIYLVDRGN